MVVLGHMEKSKKIQFKKNYFKIKLKKRERESEGKKSFSIFCQHLKISDDNEFLLWQLSATRHIFLFHLVFIISTLIIGIFYCLNYTSLLLHLFIPRQNPKLLIKKSSVLRVYNCPTLFVE